MAKKTKRTLGYSRASLKTDANNLMENCYFKIGKVVMQLSIGIPTGIDPVPFWTNLFLYSYEEDYISSLISSDKVKARHFHSTKRFIDDLYSINDGREFGKSFSDIYPTELELKFEHQGSPAGFLDLDITIKKGTLSYLTKEIRFRFPLCKCLI